MNIYEAKTSVRTLKACCLFIFMTLLVFVFTVFCIQVSIYVVCSYLVSGNNLLPIPYIIKRLYMVWSVFFTLYLVFNLSGL